MSDINPRELCDKCAANYAKCLNVGNNRYYICKECLRKQFPQETMHWIRATYTPAHKPMSKEELIQQWQMAYEHEDELGRLGINTGDAEQLALAHGALKMYDHLQREIDEVRNQLAKSEAETVFAQRWWAERWIEYCWLHEACRTTEELMANKVRYREVPDEMDAAAARVMEK